jgi:ketosteroid isomerase-like protein
MSEENVEVVRRGYEAFNRGDLDGMVADFAPTFEYLASGAVPGTGGVYRGPEGLKEFMSWFFGEFSDARADINELIDAGDRVLVGTTARGRGKQSGVESGWHLWHLWTLREGKIVRGEGFTDRDEALEAAGLSE